MRVELISQRAEVVTVNPPQLLTSPYGGRKIKLALGVEPYSPRTLARLSPTDSSLYRALMQLTEGDLQEFIEIWRDVFNEVISPEDARQRATALLDLYVILSSPETAESL